MPEIWPDLSSCLMKGIYLYIGIIFSHKVFRFWSISIGTILHWFYHNWYPEMKKFFVLQQLDVGVPNLKTIYSFGNACLQTWHSLHNVSIFPGRVRQPSHSIFTYTAFQAANQQWRKKSECTKAELISYKYLHIFPFVIKKDEQILLWSQKT